MSSPFRDGFLNKTPESYNDADDKAKEREVRRHISDLIQIHTPIESQECHDDQDKAVGAYPRYPCKEFFGRSIGFAFFHYSLIRTSAR